MDPLWRGVGVALVTLFTTDDRGRNSLDLDATAKHAARLVDLGVRGLLVAGSTGEADALTDAERTDLIAAVRQACPAQVPVVAGASGAWTGEIARRTRAAVAAGADAVLVAPPRRCRDLAACFTAATEAAGAAPVLAYHFPGVAGGEVPVAELPRLGVAGVKDSSGDPERLLIELQTWSGWLYVGNAVLASLAGALGATGVILAVANAVPEDCLAAWDGDAGAQRRLLGAHLAARADFPAGLKGLVARRFGTSTVDRIGG